MLRRLLISFIALIVSSHSMAANIIVSVIDQNGNPLNNIAVLAHSDDYPISEINTELTAVMDQINRQFVPHTLIVQQGTRVSFPNSDSVQHHVYSFSSAKTFELQLYSELEIEPLIFDKPGIVELGCNIHDWMLGYVFVADTPYFSRTNSAGQAELELPDHTFALSVWHPRIQDEDLALSINLDATQAGEVTIQLTERLLPSLVEYEAVEGFNNYE